MSAHGTADLAVEAIERGAYDYLAKPFHPSELVLLLRKTQERERLRRANQLLQREVERAVGERPIVAASQAMIELLELLERTAAFKTTTLLVGESGIRSAGDVRALGHAGADAVLVGERLMRAPSPGEALAELLGREAP